MQTEHVANWHDMAVDSRKAANTLVRTQQYRSCLSRAYYAAYAKVTYLLVENNVVMPGNREGPPHPGHLASGKASDKGIRELIIQRLTHWDVTKRRALSDLIGGLYTLRISADYHPSHKVNAREAREGHTMMTSVFENF